MGNPELLQFYGTFTYVMYFYGIYFYEIYFYSSLLLHRTYTTLIFELPLERKYLYYI
jgi:hypothetical protein